MILQIISGDFIEEEILKERSPRNIVGYESDFIEKKSLRSGYEVILPIISGDFNEEERLKEQSLRNIVGYESDFIEKNGH